MAERFNMRFPDGLRDHLTHVAKANGRSRNAEIVARLSMKPDRAYQPAGAITVTTRGADQTIVAVPKDLHSEIANSAALSGRSLQAECVFRLLASFADVIGTPVEATPVPAHPSRRELVAMKRKLSAILTELDEMIERSRA